MLTLFWSSRIRIRHLLPACLAVALLSSLASGAVVERPNFIFFITDDISYNDLGCYGNTSIKTPHLDRLAREGLVFDNAYLTISSCSPSRCSIITGRYPHNTGAPELHTQLPADQFVFPEALKQAGYYTVLSGKHHMGKAVNRGFSKVSPGEGPGKEGDWLQILKDRPLDRPFFFWFASSDAHRNWAINDQAPAYEPSQVTVPPFLFDGLQTRQDLTGYYHEVSRSDYFAGMLADELELQCITGNTYLIYCSDNGRPFPRCKTRLYDSGIKTPLIVRCPGQVAPGRTSSLVSAVDFASTFLDLAGLPTAETVQGVSMAPVLTDPSASIREFAFAEHNWHVFQAHERLVRTGHWAYIRNAWPERQNLCVESDPTFPAGTELWAMHEQGRLKPGQADVFLQPRSAEELYDVLADPHQLNNLAGHSGQAETLRRLREVLDRWIEQTGDTVQTDPTPDRQDAYGKRNPGWKHREFPGAARTATRINHPGPVRGMGSGE